MKRKTTLGLDVGEHHINMVELSKNAGGLRLVNFANVGLDCAQGKEEKISQLKKMVREKGIAGFPVNIGASGESVIVRYVDLPKMSRQEVEQSLKYEAQQYIPFKMEEVVFDCHILGTVSSGHNRMKVLLVAAKREAIMELVGLIRQAGLKPGLIDVNSFSLINCFQRNGPNVREDDVAALVNLEFDLVNLNILRGKIPFFSRDIPLLEDVLSIRKEKERNKERESFETMEPLLANLVRELRLSIDYFESEFEKQVSAIYLSGEGARLVQLPAFFGSHLGREINLWNPVQNLEIDSTRIDTAALKEVSSMLAVACGLALREEDNKWCK